MLIKLTIKKRIIFLKKIGENKFENTKGIYKSEVQYTNLIISKIAP
jgi:hypothetical protein